MSAAGKAWEAQLAHLHDRYLRDSRARIFRCHAGVKVLVDRGSTFVACWASEGPPDFTGVLYGSGRAVTFDAKDTTKTRWPLADLARHQARDLEAVHLAGGLAFVALRMQGEAFVLPWSELGPRFWRWQDGLAARGDASLIREPWWRPFDVMGDGWLPALPVQLKKESAA